MSYAIIRDGVVENVVEWDGESTWTPPDGTTLQPLNGSPAGPGWSFDGSEFTAPPTAPVRFVWSVADFMSKFTDEELDGVQIAGVSGTGMAQIVALRVQRNLFSRQFVESDHPKTIEGVYGLASVGLIAAERPAQILETE